MALCGAEELAVRPERENQPEAIDRDQDDRQGHA